MVSINMWLQSAYGYNQHVVDHEMENDLILKRF